MEIVKLYCLGNDYLVVGPEAQQYSLPALANLLCGLRQGIGGQGLIMLYPGEAGWAKVEFYTPQGLRIAPGADALRCAGFLLGTGDWVMDTSIGQQRVNVRNQETVLWFPPPVIGGEYQIGRDYHGYLINLVNRYFVTFVLRTQGIGIDRQGEALDRYFGGTDTVLVQDQDEVAIKIWSGGREIPGCGAGACAAAAILWYLNRAGQTLEITMPGGKVTMARTGDKIQQLAEVRMVLRAKVDAGQLEAVKI